MAIKKCPHCGAAVHVVDARSGPDDAYYRRRYVCHGEPLHRFTTYELVMGDVGGPKKTRQALGKIATDRIIALVESKL